MFGVGTRTGTHRLQKLRNEKFEKNHKISALSYFKIIIIIAVRQSSRRSPYFGWKFPLRFGKEI